MRRLFCLLLMMCLPLQSLAAQMTGVRLAGAGVSHQLDHVNDIHHHHHDDGQVHYDESDDSIEHSHESSAMAQHLPLDEAGLPFHPLNVTLADPPEPLSAVPHPYLDDPQRPPAFAPGLAAGG